MPNRNLIVISAVADRAARAAVAEGRWPRKDFFELQDRLQADVIDLAMVEKRLGWRLLRRVIGAPATQAVIAYTRRRSYGAIFTDGEHIGLPLGALLRFSHRRPRHVMIGHLMSTPTKRALIRWLRPYAGIDAVLLHAESQRQIVTGEQRLSPARAAMVPYQVDTSFWSADAARVEATETPLIATVGLEYRDYATLVEAVRGLPLNLVIAAGSRWSTHDSTVPAERIPPNVTVTSLDYLALRDLYARSRFVVVPLREVENQAGVTTILEGMAMGKAIIVTGTRGQADVVRGRWCGASGPYGAARGGPAPFGVRGPLATDETGLYVPPGDVDALRAAITYLLDHPDEAARMGAAGRRLVDGEMSLPLFGVRVAALMEGGLQRGSRPSRAAWGVAG